MAFKSVENNGGLMAEGNYEVICLKAEETETKGGTPCIAFEFQVRSDVEQKYQRKHIFRNFYKDDNGNWPVRIGQYANSMGIPKGEDFELSDLVGQCCIVHMKPYTGRNGVVRDSIQYTKPTEAGEMGEAPQTTATQRFIEVDDDEMPF